MQKITTFLSFKKDGEKAVRFYCDIFKDSKIDHIIKNPDSDQLMHSSFSLNNVEFMAIDAGDYPGFTFTDGISLYIDCKDQEEVDYYWNSLIANGGEAQACGWLKDQFGVRWQIIPRRLSELLMDKDPVKSGRVMQAMLNMVKINVAELEAAYSAE